MYLNITAVHVCTAGIFVYLLKNLCNNCTIAPVQLYYCTAVLLYTVHLYNCTLYSCTTVHCTSVQLYTVQLYNCNVFVVCTMFDQL